MASIHVETVIKADVDQVWSALRDWSVLHERLAPGFVTNTELQSEDRIVTFFNGAVVRERLVDLDDDERRLAWSIIDGPYAHHNGAAQVFVAGSHGTRFVWIADLLPYELAARTEEMMQHGVNAIKRHLESAGQGNAYEA